MKPERGDDGVRRGMMGKNLVAQGRSRKMPPPGQGTLETGRPCARRGGPDLGPAGRRGAACERLWIRTERACCEASTRSGDRRGEPPSSSFFGRRVRPKGERERGSVHACTLRRDYLCLGLRFALCCSCLSRKLCTM